MSTNEKTKCCCCDDLPLDVTVTFLSEDELELCTYDDCANTAESVIVPCEAQP